MAAQGVGCILRHGAWGCPRDDRVGSLWWAYKVWQGPVGPLPVAPVLAGNGSRARGLDHGLEHLCASWAWSEASAAPRHGRHVHGRVRHVCQLGRERLALIRKAAARQSFHCALQRASLSRTDTKAAFVV